MPQEKYYIVNAQGIKYPIDVKELRYGFYTICTLLNSKELPNIPYAEGQWLCYHDKKSGEYIRIISCDYLYMIPSQYWWCHGPMSGAIGKDMESIPIFELTKKINDLYDQSGLPADAPLKQMALCPESYGAQNCYACLCNYLLGNYGKILQKAPGLNDEFGKDMYMYLRLFLAVAIFMINNPKFSPQSNNFEDSEEIGGVESSEQCFSEEPSQIPWWTRY